MSGSKRKPEQAKDSHSDLLLNSRALTLFCLLRKSNIHKHTEPSWARRPPSWGSSHSRREMAAWQYPGRATPASVLQAVLWGEGWGKQREKGEKKMNPCHPRPQKHHLYHDCCFFKIALSPMRSLTSPFSKDGA